jgi:hypothetical protein
MNSALKMVDSSLVLPVFFAFYSVLALFNTNVYFDQWGHFKLITYVFIMIGIILTTLGVYILASSQENAPRRESLPEEVVDFSVNFKTDGIDSPRAKWKGRTTHEIITPEMLETQLQNHRLSLSQVLVE